jgi:glycosyltransferase involved in cell wall biosynthesis
LAFVVQRCGPEVYGGAEQYILKLALECAAAGAEVEIFTSQSDSYLAWNNNLPMQEVVSSGSHSKILIHRFPVIISRLRIAFAIVRRVKIRFGFLLRSSLLRKLTDWLFLFTQGPWCPDLWRTLRREHSRFDLIVCAGYLYAPTARTLASLPSSAKTIIIPMAHDEPEFFLPFVRESIQASKVLGFLSSAERQLVEKIWAEARLKINLLVPPGLSVTPNKASKGDEHFAFLPKHYLLYVGRVDINKGVDFLLDNIPLNVPLVFAGENHTQYTTADNRYFLGRVSNSERDALIKNAAALVIASRFESYSMVTADALALGTIVLALKGCEPIDELIQSYGGISCNAEEFASWAQKLHTGEKIATELLPNATKIQSERSWAQTAATLLSLVTN